MDKEGIYSCKHSGDNVLPPEVTTKPIHGMCKRHGGIGYKSCRSGKHIKKRCKCSIRWENRYKRMALQTVPLVEKVPQQTITEVKYFTQ